MEGQCNLDSVTFLFLNTETRWIYVKLACAQYVKRDLAQGSLDEQMMFAQVSTAVALLQRVAL